MEPRKHTSMEQRSFSSCSTTDQRIGFEGGDVKRSASQTRLEVISQGYLAHVYGQQRAAFHFGYHMSKDCIEVDVGCDRIHRPLFVIDLSTGTVRFPFSGEVKKLPPRESIVLRRHQECFSVEQDVYVKRCNTARCDPQRGCNVVHRYTSILESIEIWTNSPSEEENLHHTMWMDGKTVIVDCTKYTPPPRLLLGGLEALKQARVKLVAEIAARL